MTQAQWTLFFQELEKINSRDCLIGKVILQGGKRANEVLKLTADRIDFKKRQISFFQSKAKGLIKETVITYPESIMWQLKEYMGNRKGLVFITRGEKPVLLTQIAITFARAGERAGIGFKVYPHTLRASAVIYLKQQGFRDTDIMKITGHASSEMVYAYDKSERADNPTKKVSLVQ
jgi:integrase